MPPDTPPSLKRSAGAPSPDASSHPTSNLSSHAGPPTPHTRFGSVWRAALCLLIGAAGGYGADLAGAPLPYMLGSVAATIFAALIRMPIVRPQEPIVIPMRVVLGVVIGATVTPELLAKLADVAGTAAFVPLYVSVVALIGTAYYRIVGRYSREEALFCALPGGLLIMTTMAQDTGVDIRRVSLAHALRIAFVVLTIPFIAQALVGVDSIETARGLVPVNALPPREMALLAAAGIVGWWGARALRLPAGQIIGPLVASAALHLTGISQAKPPQELVYASQVVLGAHIGARFVGEKFALLREAVGLAAGHTAMMLCLSLGFAFALQALFGLSLITGLLCFAPGGMSENALIALGLGLDVAFIIAVQISRMMFISLTMPLVYARLQPLLRR
ncbi:MAG: AbrB family transcriptional regulator [Pseudomonadota bacterium]